MKHFDPGDDLTIDLELYKCLTLTFQIYHPKKNFICQKQTFIFDRN